MYKFSSDQFLGLQELNKFQDSIFDDGFVKLLLESSISFGVVYNVADGNWTNFRIEQGVNVGTIKNSEGFAIDNQGRFIRRAAKDNIAIANDNAWKWIKIAHLASPVEPYLVNIGANGNLTATGGKFTEILRGVPNNPSKISFVGGANTGEYTVHSVIDDNNAVLQGVFVPESNVEFRVVGTFTPDTITPSQSKYPFQYDNCTMSVVSEVTPNTPPTSVTGEYWIARVKRNGSDLQIQDKRGLNIYRSKVDYELATVDSQSNPLAGIESVRFNGIRTTRAENIVYVSWAFKSDNWTFIASTNTVTLNAGYGGKFKSTSDFTDGDFDGWLLWTANGKKHKIKQSSKQSTQINIVLDSLDSDDYEIPSQELVISPDVSEVELIFNVPGGESTLTQKRATYQANTGTVKVLLPVYKQTTCQYIVSYRYKVHKSYSIERLIPDDVSVGYFVEAAFDGNGNLIGSTRQTYSNGIITLQEASNSYANRIASVETGDLLGVEYVAIDTAINPVTTFQVGTRRNYVVITNDDDLSPSDSDFGSVYQLTADAYLDLRSDVPSTLKNGNNFYIHFRGLYDLNGFRWYIVQDFINSGNPGIMLMELSANDIALMADDNLIIRAWYDGSRWFLQRIQGGGEDSLQFIIDGGGQTIVTGQKGHLVVPYSCRIKGWTLLANTSGSVVVDIWKDTYANFPPTNLDSIAGSEKPTLSSVAKAQDNNLTTWSLDLVKGDILGYNIDSVSAISRLTLNLDVSK